MKNKFNFLKTLFAISLASASFAATAVPYEIIGDWKVSDWGTNYADVPVCALDNQGGLWFTVTNVGLKHFLNDSLHDTQTSGLPQPQAAKSVYVDDQDTVFIAIFQSLYKGKPGAWQEIHQYNSSSIRGISKNSKGELYAVDGGLLKFENDTPNYIGVDIGFNYKMWFFDDDKVMFAGSGGYVYRYSPTDSSIYYTGSSAQDLQPINKNTFITTFGPTSGGVHTFTPGETGSIFSNSTNLWGFHDSAPGYDTYPTEFDDTEGIGGLGLDENGLVWVGGYNTIATYDPVLEEWTNKWDVTSAGGGFITDILIKNGRLFGCGKGAIYEYLGDLHLPKSSSSSDISSSSDDTQIILKNISTPDFSYNEKTLSGIAKKNESLNVLILNHLGQVIEEHTVNGVAGKPYNLPLSLTPGYWHIRIKSQSGSQQTLHVVEH